MRLGLILVFIGFFAQIELLIGLGAIIIIADMADEGW